VDKKEEILKQIFDVFEERNNNVKTKTEKYFRLAIRKGKHLANRRKAALGAYFYALKEEKVKFSPFELVRKYNEIRYVERLTRKQLYNYYKKIKSFLEEETGKTLTNYEPPTKEEAHELYHKVRKKMKLKKEYDAIVERANKEVPKDSNLRAITQNYVAGLIYYASKKLKDRTVTQEVIYEHIGVSNVTVRKYYRKIARSLGEKPEIRVFQYKPQVLPEIKGNNRYEKLDYVMEQFKKKAFDHKVLRKLRKKIEEEEFKNEV